MTDALEGTAETGRHRRHVDDCAALAAEPRRHAPDGVLVRVKGTREIDRDRPRELLRADVDEARVRRENAGVVEEGVETAERAVHDLERRTDRNRIGDIALNGDRPPAEVLDCSLVPTHDQYAILLQIPGEVGKGVLLPRRVAERALDDAPARARVRNLLRAATEALRSQRAITEARHTAYFTALNVQSLPGPRCARCEGPLLAEDPVVIHHGSRRHLACPPAW